MDGHLVISKRMFRWSSLGNVKEGDVVRDVEIHPVSVQDVPANYQDFACPDYNEDRTRSRQ
jgi:hypothetical protein